MKHQLSRPKTQLNHNSKPNRIKKNLKKKLDQIQNFLSLISKSSFFFFPSLYPDHRKDISNIYKSNKKNTFRTQQTTARHVN